MGWVAVEVVADFRNYSNPNFLENLIVTDFCVTVDWTQFLVFADLGRYSNQKIILKLNKKGSGLL